MFNPSIDELVKKAGNRYRLCVASSQRAKEIILDECEKETENETFKYKKPLTIAVEELLNGSFDIE